MSPQRAQSPRAVTKASLSVAHQSRIESVRDPEDVPSECPTPTLPPPPRLVARGATGDGEVPWDSARFVSRLNAVGVRVRHLRTERVVLNGPTSESKPTGQVRTPILTVRPAFIWIWMTAYVGL